MLYVFHDILTNSAKKFPRKIALQEGQRKINYSRLNYLSTIFAKNIISKINKGDRIGILYKNSIDSVIAMFGVSKAGGVVVLLNYSSKPKQIEYIINNCEIKKIITDNVKFKNLRKNFNNVKINLITDYLDETKNKSTYNFLPNIIDRDIAILIYTSGSTGFPKGIILTHYDMVMATKIMADVLKNTYSDNLLGLLPFYFDYGMTQLLTMIYVGGKLTIMDSFFPNDITTTLIKDKITGFSAIPNIWINLYSNKSKFPNNKYKHLKYITIAGGKISKLILDKLKQTLPKIKIYILYGLTEAFFSTWLPPDELETHPDSIGIAMPNIEIFVINEKGKICKPGEIGELVHRGGVIAQGYWKDIVRTKKTFRPIKFFKNLLNKNEIVVYSGDIVKSDEDGYLYFLGRIDQQIKSSGYRICREEIETYIYETGLVKSCAVFGIDDAKIGQKIVLSFVPKRVKKNIIKQLKRSLSKNLPKYMVPHIFNIENNLPKTASGKIDVKTSKNNYINKIT